MPKKKIGNTEKVLTAPKPFLQVYLQREQLSETCKRLLVSCKICRFIKQQSLIPPNPSLKEFGKAKQALTPLLFSLNVYK